MITARFGNLPVCARCGCYRPLTKDHFIPKSSHYNVNYEGNYVGLCNICNREKGNRIVLPSYYRFLSAEQQHLLNNVMRYTRRYIIGVCNDSEIIDYISKL